MAVIRINGLHVITRREARSRGFTRYFTGKPCGHGHASERYTKSTECCECAKLKLRRKYAEDKEYQARASKKYYLKNKDKILDKGREWRANNPERAIELNRNWRENNRDKVRESVRKWTNSNRDRQRLLNIEWGKKNPDKRKEIDHRRRSKKAGADGSHTKEDIMRIRENQRDRCAYCRDCLHGKGHVDHIIALARGGSDWPKNLQLLCVSCNSSKGAKDPVDYAVSVGKLI